VRDGVNEYRQMVYELYSVHHVIEIDVVQRISMLMQGQFGSPARQEELAAIRARSQGGKEGKP